MKIEHIAPFEVLFGTLNPGQVFTNREGKAHLKTKAQIFEKPNSRYNVVVLGGDSWLTWFDDSSFVRFHPDATLILGQVGK